MSSLLRDWYFQCKKCASTSMVSTQLPPYERCKDCGSIEIDQIYFDPTPAPAPAKPIRDDELIVLSLEIQFVDHEFVATLDDPHDYFAMPIAKGKGASRMKAVMNALGSIDLDQIVENACDECGEIHDSENKKSPIDPKEPNYATSDAATPPGFTGHEGK